MNPLSQQLLIEAAGLCAEIKTLSIRQDITDYATWTLVFLESSVRDDKISVAKMQSAIRYLKNIEMDTEVETIKYRAKCVREKIKTALGMDK